MQLLKGKNGRTADTPHKNGKAEALAIQTDDKSYRPTDKEPFMNDRQRDYFRQKLLDWREDILKEAKETLQHLQDENQNHPDQADRDAVDRSAGTPRTARARLSRRIGRLAIDAERRFLRVLGLLSVRLPKP